MDKIKHYEVTFESDVYAISLVDEPAIESDFIFLKKENEKQVFLQKDDKHLIVGAVLIPDKPIYRNNGKEEYFLQFSSQTIEKLAYEYLMNGRMYNVTTDHQDIADDICLVESWIKTSDNDKSVDYGIDVPIGSWLVAMKVENEDVWSRIKSGELRGYSVESFVNLDEINLQKQYINMQDEVKDIQVTDSFWDKLKSIIAEAMGKGKEDPAVEEKVEEVKEEIVEETTEVTEELAAETEEVVEVPEEEVEAIVEEVVQTVEEVAVTEEDKTAELEQIIKGLEEEIAKKDEQIAEMNKQIQKMSKQPSIDPVKVEASAQKQHPSFLDFALGRVKY